MSESAACTGFGDCGCDVCCPEPGSGRGVGHAGAPLGRSGDTEPRPGEFAAQGRDWTTEPYTKDELLVENVQMVRRLTLGDIEDGADPVAALNKALDCIVGFIEGRHGMIVPPHMIPPAELEEAVAWGRKLAEEHGW